MLIQLILMLLAPAVISVYLFEMFKGDRLSIEHRIVFFIVFAFLINMIVYAAIWLRGWETISWSLGSDSEMKKVSFCLKYMALSLLFSAAIPYALSLIKAGKKKDQISNE